MRTILESLKSAAGWLDLSNWSGSEKCTSEMELARGASVAYFIDMLRSCQEAAEYLYPGRRDIIRVAVRCMDTVQASNPQTIP